MPRWFAEEKQKTAGFQFPHVGILGVNVSHDEVDVDYVFGGEVGDAGGSLVVDGEEIGAESGGDTGFDLEESCRPGWVGLDDGQLYAGFAVVDSFYGAAVVDVMSGDLFGSEWHRGSQ